jgi:hypothetical protein
MRAVSSALNASHEAVCACAAAATSRPKTAKHGAGARRCRTAGACICAGFWQSGPAARRRSAPRPAPG